MLSQSLLGKLEVLAYLTNNPRYRLMDKGNEVLLLPTPERNRIKNIQGCLISTWLSGPAEYLQ